MGYLGLLAPKDNFNFPEHLGSYIVFSLPPSLNPEGE